MNNAPLLMAGALVASIVLGGAASAAPTPGQSCFQMTSLQSTRPDGDKTIYARVGVKQIYRIDLAHRCPELLSREGIVITPTGGRNLICGPLDFDLRARDVGGSSTPCFVERISKLSPEEAAALPKKVVP